MNLSKKSIIVVIFVLCFLIYFSAKVNSYTVNVDIVEYLESTVILADNSKDNNLVELDYDVFNSGSMGYTARLRMDVYNSTVTQNRLLATVWSREIQLQPGDRKPVSLYWYGNGKSGNFTTVIRAYRAHDIDNAGQFTVELKDVTDAGEDIFTIERIRVYDNKIMLYLKSSSDTKNVIIYPVKYPLGWMFEQEALESMQKDKGKWIDIYYEPSLFSARNITIAIIGDKGKYYGEKTLSLTKEQGLSKYAHMIEDILSW